MSGVVEDILPGLACRRCSAWKFCSHFQDGRSAGRSGSVRGDLYAADESVYLHGDPVRSLYVVCDGMVKTETESREGKLQVTGFLMPGEIFGLEGMGSEEYPGSAMACVDSRICAFPLEDILHRCGASQEFLQETLFGMGRRIRFAGCKWKLVESETAYFRVLFFLCDLLIRQQGGSVSAGVVLLRMEKRDISNFLGMNPSTLSRELWKLEGDGLIRRESKEQVQVGSEALSMYLNFT